jgi:hypothetical protein
MIRKIFIFSVFILCLLLFAGCGGGGGKSPKDPPKPSNPEVEQFLSAYETAVEAYDKAGVLNCLSDTFNLRITEGGREYDKDKTKLAGELSDTAPGGGYALDLQLDAPNYSNQTATTITVTQTFAVYEQNASLPKTKTDNGTITWQLDMSSGTWKAAAMHIVY